MRKQDEMENLRIENDRLRVDNAGLEEELKRLRCELGGQPGAFASNTFSPRVKRECMSRPITPADSMERSMSTDSTTSSPQSLPSLSYSTSSTPSNDFDSQSEHRPLFAEHLTFDPSTINPSDLKRTDVSRSAETCSLQWTSDTHKIMVVSPTPRRSHRLQTKLLDE